LNIGDDELSKSRGMYKGSFTPDLLGHWRIELSDIHKTEDKTNEKVAKKFEVFTKSLEDKSPKMDKSGLTNLARANKARSGNFFFPWELPLIPKFINEQPLKVTGSTKTDELWDEIDSISLSIMRIVDLQQRVALLERTLEFINRDHKDMFDPRG